METQAGRLVDVHSILAARAFKKSASTVKGSAAEQRYAPAALAFCFPAQRNCFVRFESSEPNNRHVTGPGIRNFFPSVDAVSA
jgi:hypothetical protein